MNKGIKIIVILVLGVFALILSSYTRTFSKEYIQFPILIAFFWGYGWLISRFYKKLWPYPILFLLPTLIMLVIAFIINKSGLFHYIGESIMIIPTFFFGYYFSRLSLRWRFITIPLLSIFYFFYISKINPELNYYNNSIVLSKIKGSPLINFQFIKKDSSILMLDKYKGKVILLDFYFNNCTPCIKKMLSLRKLQNHYKENKNFTLFAVHRGGSESYAEFLNKLKNFPNNLTYVYDSLSAASKYLDITGYPFEIIIDKHGNVRETIVGFNDDLSLVYEKNNIKKINILLNEK